MEESNRREKKMTGNSIIASNAKFSQLDTPS
jgi:hypothetical protein